MLCATAVHSGLPTLGWSGAPADGRRRLLPLCAHAHPRRALAGEDTHYRGSDSGSDIDLFGEVDKGDRRSCNPPSKVQGSLVYVNGHPIKESDIK